MKRIWYMFVFVLILSGCETKEINVFPVFEESIKFKINSSDFNYTGVIKASDIMDAIDGIVEDEDDISKVLLEEVWFEVRPETANSASSLNVDLSIRSWIDNNSKKVLDDYGVKIGTTNSIEPVLAGLQDEGVSELLHQLTQIVKGAENDIRISVDGVAIPDGTVADLELELFIRGTVKVSQEVPSL
jgi:hypothetical protein